MGLNDLRPFLTLHGRTRQDADCLYMNWTCSGFSVRFTGRTLKAKLRAVGEKQPIPQDAPLEYPWVGVTVDGSSTLVNRFECTQEEAWYSLWESPDDGPHTIRLIKLTENARGKLGLLDLQTDGVLSAVPTENSLKIEFVGDSITCGFGNKATNRDALFNPAEENGWIAYAAITARELCAEFDCISVSGISVSAPEKPMFPMKPMNELYAYTDRLYDERMGYTPLAWDFLNHKKDLILINLGTNDVNPIRFYEDLEQADREETYFVQQYKDFLRKIRTLNGPDTKIVCTLGPMDYYLYDNIRTAVAEYRGETGDDRVYALKLIGVNLMTEGFGAVGHPSEKTHARLGHELALRLKEIL